MVPLESSHSCDRGAVTIGDLSNLVFERAELCSVPFTSLDTASPDKFPEFSEEISRYRVAFACPREDIDGVQNYDDFELVAAATAGELEAFGELIRRHQDFVYGSVLRVVKNPTLAEDISQDCFLRAYRALPDFRGDSQVRSWLYRIAHNLAINAVTRRREYPTDIMPEILASTEVGRPVPPR